MVDIEEVKRRTGPIFKKHGINRAGVFGSVARGETHANDIDLLVKIERQISLLDFIGIKLELEEVLNMRVDLVEYDALKPTIKEEILREEVPVI